MRQRKSNMCRQREMADQVVVLRKIPKRNQDESIEGNYVFCDCNYPKKRFEIIVDEPDKIGLVFQKQRVTVNSDGFLVVDDTYIAQAQPPITCLCRGDLVLRLSRGCQELYVEGTDQVQNVQKIYLVNRSQSEGTVPEE